MKVMGRKLKTKRIRSMLNRIAKIKVEGTVKHALYIVNRYSYTPNRVIF